MNETCWKWVKPHGYRGDRSCSTCSSSLAIRLQDPWNESSAEILNILDSVCGEGRGNAVKGGNSGEEGRGPDKFLFFTRNERNKEPSSKLL